VVTKPIDTILKKEHVLEPVTPIEDKPKIRRPALQAARKTEVISVDVPVGVTEAVTKVEPKRTVLQVQDVELAAPEPVLNERIHEPGMQAVAKVSPMEQDDTKAEPSLFELAAAELHLPIVELGPEPQVTVERIEQSAEDVQSVYVEHTPEERIVTSIVEVLAQESDMNEEAVQEKVEQVTHFVAAMPEDVSEAIVVKFESGEPEEVEQIEQLVVQLATATDRLHNLAMSEALDSEEAVQIEALVEVWYAELCEAVGVISEPDEIKRFIALIKSPEYKLQKREQNHQDKAITIDHEAWYNPQYDFTSLAHGHVALFIRQQLHSRLGGLSVKALMV
jgi:hypothetical protein